MAEVLQNLLDKFNRMEITEKKVSELEDRSVETIQYEESSLTTEKNKSLRHLLDNISQKYMQLKGKGKKIRQKNIFEEIMTGNFMNLLKT